MPTPQAVACTAKPDVLLLTRADVHVAVFTLVEMKFTLSDWKGIDESDWSVILTKQAVVGVALANTAIEKM